MLRCIDWVLLKLASLVGSRRAQQIYSSIIQPSPAIVTLGNADLNPTSQIRNKFKNIFETQCYYKR